MTSPPIFHGVVEPGGKLVVHRREAMEQHIKSLSGGPVEIAIRRRRSQRTLKQNALHWAVIVPAIAEALGYDRHEYEQVHYALVAKCFGTDRDPITGLEVPKARSSRLTTTQFNELIEWEVRFAAQDLGVAIMLPDDIPMSAYGEAAA